MHFSVERSLIAFAANFEGRVPLYGFFAICNSGVNFFHGVVENTAFGYACLMLECAALT